jgi:hypothetical protein
LTIAALSTAAQAKPRVTAEWVLEKPQAMTQVQKSVEERGVNPCNTPDPGFGAYRAWSRSPSLGQMIVPRARALRGGQWFDVMIHFHGHEAARKEWVRVLGSPVLVGIDLGLGSGPYESQFAAPGEFERLLTSIEAGVAGALKVPNARARFVGLSAWSAGYGAVGRILSRPEHAARIDSVILLDGLHSGYSRHDGGTLNEAQLSPFADFAALAAQGRRFMFVSHSSIIPPGYASTTETANYLIASVGGRPVASRPRGSDPMGLDLIAWYRQRNFHVRGFAGNDKMDHCAHFGVYADVLRIHLRRRWR